MQTSKRQLCFALDTRRRKHAKARGGRHRARRAKKRGFADARITANNQCIAPLLAPRKHGLQDLGFARAAIQLGALGSIRGGHAGNYGRLECVASDAWVATGWSSD